MLNKSVIFYIFAVISIGIAIITLLFNNITLTLFFIILYMILVGLRYYHENKEQYEYSEDFKEQFK